MAGKGDLTPEQITLRDRYAEGLAAYRARRWDEARACFPCRARPPSPMMSPRKSSSSAWMILRQIHLPQLGTAPGISIINSRRYRWQHDSSSGKQRPLAQLRSSEPGGRRRDRVQPATGATRVFSPSWVSNKMPPGRASIRRAGPQQSRPNGRSTMRDRNWSRRDVLKTSTALAATALFAEPVRAAAPPPSSVTPELIEAAQEGRQDLVLFGAGAQCRGTAGQGVRGQISRDIGPGRALRRRADLSAHRAGAGQRHQRGRRRQQHRPRALSRLESQGLACAVSP